MSKRKRDDNEEQQGTIPKPKQQKPKRIFGKGTYCICGIMRQGSNSSTIADLKRHGAKVSERVTKKVTHLIVDWSNSLSDSTKVPTALRYGIKIVSQEWMYASIERGERLDERFYLYAPDEPDREASLPIVPRPSFSLQEISHVPIKTLQQQNMMPGELSLLLFEYLANDARHLLRCSLVCKSWNELLSRDNGRFWFHGLKRLVGQSNPRSTREILDYWNKRRVFPSFPLVEQPLIWNETFGVATLPNHIPCLEEGDDGCTDYKAWFVDLSWAQSLYDTEPTPKMIPIILNFPKGYAESLPSEELQLPADPLEPCLATEPHAFKIACKAMGLGKWTWNVWHKRITSSDHHRFVRYVQSNSNETMAVYKITYPNPEHIFCVHKSLNGNLIGFLTQAGSI